MLHLLSTFITSVIVECTPERPQQNDSGSIRPFRGAIGNAQAMDNGLSQIHDPAAKAIGVNHSYCASQQHCSWMQLGIPSQWLSGDRSA